MESGRPLSPRRSTTQAPRNWSFRWCAARASTETKPTLVVLHGDPGSGRTTLAVRAACTHCAIRVRCSRRPANGPCGSGRWPNDCSSTDLRRAAALRSAPRSRGAGAAAFFAGRAAADSIRCWSRNGRMPRTSRAVSHCRRNCSGPPG
ncbi:hypothetical protein EAO77_36745 [Streptomyces sp. t39]|nr:hypothetical protein EAO77_36745 [Streptomyces sp. t39]